MALTNGRRATRSLLRLLLLFACALAAVLAVTTSGAAADTGVDVAEPDTRYVPGPDGTTIVVSPTRTATIVLNCADRECTTYERVVLAAPRFGPSDLVLADGDGRVHIVSKGGVIRCLQPACAGGETTSIAPPGLRFVRMTSDGRLAGITSTTPPQAVFCADPACTSTTSHPLPDGAVSSVVMVDDNYVTYQVDGGAATLTARRCVDGCATSTVTTSSLPANLFANGAQASVAAFVGSGGSVPTLLMRVGQSQYHVACDTVDCASPVTTATSGILTGGGVAVNDVGNFVYLTNSAVATCGDPGCVDRQVLPNLEAIRRLSVDELGRPQFLTNRFLVTCDARVCTQPEFTPSIRGGCRSTFSGTLQMAVVGSLVGWTLRSGDAESDRRVNVGANRLIRMDGRDANGPVAAVAAAAGVEAGSAVVNFACSGPAVHDASWSCLAGKGRIDVRVASEAVPATFEVHIGNVDPRLITIDADTPVTEVRHSSAFDYPAHGSIVTTVTARDDGPTLVSILDQATGVEVFRRTLDLKCRFRAVAGPEVTIVGSCLAGMGRIDTNIVNTATGQMRYLVKTYRGNQLLFARSQTIASGDWWRSPVTGRTNGAHRVVVETQANGFTPPVRVAQRTVDMNCDPGAESIDEPEVRVVNACRSDRGYIMFIFTNNTAVAKPYVLTFTGVPNRSTTAPPFGQAVKFVTGRPNGTYTASIQGGAPITVDVAC